jgi:hypothetical protein
VDLTLFNLYTLYFPHSLAALWNFLLQPEI